MAVYGLKKHYFFKLKVIKKWKFNHLAFVSIDRAKVSYGYLSDFTVEEKGNKSIIFCGRYVSMLMVYVTKKP